MVSCGKLTDCKAGMVNGAGDEGTGDKSQEFGFKNVKEVGSH